MCVLLEGVVIDYVQYEDLTRESTLIVCCALFVVNYAFSTLMLLVA